MKKDDTHTIEKLAYHISLLSRSIDRDNFPVEALILDNNWDRAELNKAHDVFERWDKRIESGARMDTDAFEADFAREMGIDYQGLKSVLLAFYRNHQWTNVCEAYVDAFEGSPSAELRSIMLRERR